MSTLDDIMPRSHSVDGYMTQPNQSNPTNEQELREELEIRLCINGCQQRTAGYNEAKQGKKGLDTDDMERMETIAVNEVMELIATYRKKWETEAYTNGFRAGAIDTLLELKSQVKAQGENK